MLNYSKTYPQIPLINADFKRGNLVGMNPFLKRLDSLFSELEVVQESLRFPSLICENL